MQQGMEKRMFLTMGLNRINTFLFSVNSMLSPVFTNTLLGLEIMALNAESRTIPCRSSVLSTSIVAGAGQYSVLLISI